jgi:hypothetical protein
MGLLPFWPSREVRGYTEILTPGGARIRRYTDGSTELITPADVVVREIPVQEKICLWCKYPIQREKVRCENCGGHA